MATENTALRGKTRSSTRQASLSHTLPANPSTGDLVVIGVAGYTDLDPNDALAAGDLTQTGGTATLSSWQLHRTDKNNNGSIEVDTAIYSARVLSGGSLTVQISKGIDRYWTLGSTGFSGSWDDSRQIAVSGASPAGPNVTSVSPTGNDANSGDVLVGLMGLVPISGTGTITLSSGQYAEAWSEQEASLYEAGAMASRIASTGLTGDAPTWTISGSLATNSGAATSMVVLRESGGDTTAPVLTSATRSATSSSTATVGATTDEANGTMYAVVTTSDTKPSVAQIKAGQDHTGAAAPWSGSQAISSTGAKTFSAVSLSPATQYYAHFVHTDSSANDSNRLSSTAFTTYQLLVPTSTIANSGWEASDAGTLHAALGSGAAYARTTTPGASFTVALTPAGDPAVSTGYEVAYEIRGNGTSGMQVELLEGAAVRATFTYDPAPATDTLLSEVLSAGQADSISDHTALRLRFTEI